MSRRVSFAEGAGYASPKLMPLVDDGHILAFVQILFSMSQTSALLEAVSSTNSHVTLNAKGLKNVGIGKLYIGPGNFGGNCTWKNLGMRSLPIESSSLRCSLKRNNAKAWQLGDLSTFQFFRISCPNRFAPEEAGEENKALCPHKASSSYGKRWLTRAKVGRQCGPTSGLGLGSTQTSQTKENKV